MVARAASSQDRSANRAANRAAVPQSRGPQQVFRIPALESSYVEDLRLALEDLGIPDATILLPCKGMPKYRSLWHPYKRWCTDNNRLILSCTFRDAFCARTAAAQLADFLASISESTRVNVVNTLCNYRSCINKFFVVVFECDPLTDSARVKMVIDGFGKDHPSQPRWADDETCDPGCIVQY